MAKSEIRVPALEVKQGERSLYTFAVDGKDLPLFTTVSRIHRSDDKRLAGYQRSEAQSHIGSIKRYLETANAILPNALVVAFDDRVRFKAADGRKKATGSKSRVGEIVIPVEKDQPDEDKPGWIVDGQQRSAALREADIEGFPVFVTAFVAEHVAEQRSQFILVNSTKPLPKGLIYELLPETPAEDLPVVLLRRRYPAILLERLNLDEDSPLRLRIKTPTIIEGDIKDNSILTMLSASLEDGALYEHFDSPTGEGDTEAMLRILKAFWGAVAHQFPEAWQGTPRTSRLVHGVGIASMGVLMDEIVFRLGDDVIPSQSEFAAEIRKIADACAWTEGEWSFGPQGKTGWDELQNTPGELQALSDHVLDLYRDATRRNRATQAV
jgi:DGQHR domain-containing protein